MKATIRGNGSVIYPKEAVLPKKRAKKETYSGTIKVLETFNNKSEVNQSDWQDELAPDRPFVETLDAINKDGRLNLAIETYNQMILGKGLKVTAKNGKVQEMVNEWLEESGFDEFLEDGIHSYIATGNWIIEKSPTNDEFVEVPITTVRSITRNARGHVKRYVQHVNEKDIFFKPSEVIHFKLTNVAREPFARGLFHSILSDYEDPRTGEVYDSPLIQMKQIEDAMPKIFQGHADPTVMFHFEDAGEQFIKSQADALKKMQKGSKIVTDKAFDVKVIETAGNSKFEGYIEHMQRDLLEPGSKFPLQFFNAGFTARAASESTDSVLIRKVKRIQVRLANQIKRNCIMPYLKTRGKRVKSADIQVFFESPQKQEASIDNVITSYRDNILRRSEARKWLIDNTNVKIDQTDMDDEPPITSVTPTNQLADNREEPQEEPKEEPETSDNDKEEKVFERVMTDLKNMVNVREELEAHEKRKNTSEILKFIKELKSNDD
jgi:hypothetical protein